MPASSGKARILAALALPSKETCRTSGQACPEAHQTSQVLHSLQSPLLVGRVWRFACSRPRHLRSLRRLERSAGPPSIQILRHCIAFDYIGCQRCVAFLASELHPALCAAGVSHSQDAKFQGGSEGTKTWLAHKTGYGASSQSRPSYSQQASVMVFCRPLRIPLLLPRAPGSVPASSG